MSAPIALRPHHVLCLQGFRGKGYSPEFVSNLSVIAERLRRNPATEVLLIAGFDEICGPCPHKKDDGCSKGGSPDYDPALMDLKVLRKLGLVEKRKISWLNILEAIKNRLSCEELREICRGCQWFAEGDCLEGLEKLLRGPTI